MAEMRVLQELQRQHRVFAEETFAYLMKKSGIESNVFTECEFFRPYIGDAIVTISHVFRKDYRKVFRRLGRNLEHVRMFENYCMIVPATKDKRYFYYILRRVSLIFELGLYCYSEGYDYFKTGQKCVAEYEDLQYFESAGSWCKLEHTALIIASFGWPLTLITAPNYVGQGKNFQTLYEAFAALDKHLIIDGDLNMLDGAEMHYLREQSRLFQTRKAKTKCFQKEKLRNETESANNLKASDKASFGDTEGLSFMLMTEYFKTCLRDLISSKTQGYVLRKPDQENKAKTAEDKENSTGDVKDCDLQNSALNFDVDFSDKKVAYIQHYKPSYPDYLIGRSVQPPKGSTVCEDNECFVFTTDEAKLFWDLFSRCFENGLCECAKPGIDVCESNPLSPNQSDAPLKSASFVPVEICEETECPEKYLVEMVTAKPEDMLQKTDNYTSDENLASRKECHPSFIVPNRYLNLKNPAGTSKCLHLYTMKMWPPSKREKLSEPIKKLLDENIEGQSFNTMLSGDILVCPRVSSGNNDTLLILAESSTDDEVDEDIDALICLFKKMEIDSLDNERVYSLRSRQPNLLRKERSRNDLDKTEIMTGEITSDEEPPMKKISRTRKRSQVGCIENEKLHAKKLIRLYRRNFTTFLDEYFTLDFLDLIDEHFETFYPIIQYYGKYVFAVTVSIMAKRKGLLGEPDETKRVMGINLSDAPFQPRILPLEVQRTLDSHIRDRNYFAAPNGVYGVGPKRKTPRENIWVIFFSGNGDSETVKYRNDDFKEIPKVFGFYRPVLEYFIDVPSDCIQVQLDSFELCLMDLVADSPVV